MSTVEEIARRNTSPTIYNDTIVRMNSLKEDGRFYHVLVIFDRHFAATAIFKLNVM